MRSTIHPLFQPIDPLTRIKQNTVIDKNGCWVWQRHLQRGYAVISVNGKARMVARFMFELYFGPIPPGIRCHHKCHNAACCNPQHFEVISPFEHVERSPKGLAFIHRHKTHCLRGHEFTKENTYIDKKKHGRNCRKCSRERERSRRKLIH